ncbi:DUF2834 domain-containing protein [Leptothoe sp. PORK10 BA2]|uniref:DUF2834 domain-containing protein n=1 Tax=Leptothoe sp. PORK10 BA2 TaxID=3110254 RepID=UPI002B1F2582|nr:DUF2834 domain-containing protein [Leptothoe sp. PORK10 BA2]MEA5462443.1 DUF2834 domain-containing protein [Leptothoe sp. PORK10 BA2]
MNKPKEVALTPVPVRPLRQFALGALWLGFVTYGVLLSPPSAPDTLGVILQLSTGQWAELNPWVVVLFNLMGLWPVIYASLALDDGRDQAVPAWPFVVGSFGLGAFALLPYLALRKSTATLPREPVDSLLLRVMHRRWVGVGVAILTLLLLAYGFTQGQGQIQGQGVWQDFLDQFSTSQFIHVMSLDFCLLTLLTPSLLWDDMARRQASPLWRGVSLLPLLGPAIYLALRPTGAAANVAAAKS